MGYNIAFHRVNEDPRVLTKTLSTSNRYAIYNDIKFKQGRGLDEIVYDLEIAPSNAFYQLITRSTYAVLTGTNISGMKTYYYFVQNVEIVRTGLIRFILKIDPLMTWNSEIKALTCTLDRSETIFNGYLPDSEYTALGYRAIVCKAFPDALDDDSYILMTTG